MQNALLKYKIGLAVIMICVIGLAGWLGVQSNATKADSQTQKTATEVAEQLNDYVSQKQKIPDALIEAGVTDAPGEITYKKLSSERYEFCVNYRTASSGYSVTGLESIAMAALYGSSSYDFSSEEDDSELSYLYISYSHSKGENCQTVKPYIYSYGSDYYNNNRDGNSGSSSCTYDYYAKDQDQELDDYYSCLDRESKSPTVEPDSFLVQ